MTAATEKVRRLPGDLEFLTPNCPICAEYTDAINDGLSCFPCGIAWGRDGENPERIDPDAKQCASLHRVGFGLRANDEHRCWRDAGHKGDHHNPDSFYSWTTAEQSGEAES